MTQSTTPDSNAQTLPEDRLIRLKHVLELIPVSACTWWRGVADGIYPAGVKLGRQITAWRYSDIKKLFDGLKL